MNPTTPDLLQNLPYDSDSQGLYKRYILKTPISPNSTSKPIPIPQPYFDPHLDSLGGGYSVTHSRGTYSNATSDWKNQ